MRGKSDRYHPVPDDNSDREKTFTQIYVGGISRNVNEDMLQKHFEKVGEVTMVCMKRGFAFVSYKNHDDAVAAIKQFNDTEFEGGKIEVQQPSKFDFVINHFFQSPTAQGLARLQGLSPRTGASNATARGTGPMNARAGETSADLPTGLREGEAARMRGDTAADQSK